MASFWPTMRLSSVDLPALGRPMRATKPHFMQCAYGLTSASAALRRRTRTLVMRRRSTSSTSNGQVVDLERLADVRHPAEVRQQVAADVSKPFALDLDAQPIAHLVDADLAAEDERAVALVGHRLALDVVLVANLADDLLEQILDGHEPGGAAVLVDDDRHLRLPALHLLQQLRDALALRHEVAPTASASSAAARRPAAAPPGPSRTRCRRCCRGCRGRPACASTAPRGTATRRSCSVASARMATMSGRGVITSRTTVSVKSTIDCSSSRPSSSEISPFLGWRSSGCRVRPAASAPLPPLAASRSRRRPRIC